MQVCSYRVIASYESPLFENFSKCILQRHNCLGLKADIPMVPDPVPMAEFRGAKLTWDAAEDIFIGHLAPQAPRAPGAEKDGFSWRVACGKNPGTSLQVDLPCRHVSLAVTAMLTSDKSGLAQLVHTLMHPEVVVTHATSGVILLQCENS